MILKTGWSFLDGSDPTNPNKHVEVPAGRHEIERVSNPFGFENKWLVLKGTKTGAGEGSIREYPQYITIEE